MKQLLAILSFLACTLTVQAQTFTQHLQKTDAGGGSLVIVQSAEIENAVNTKKSSAKERGNRKPAPTGHDSTAVRGHHGDGDSRHDSGTPHYDATHKPERMMGYRIQIYAGPRGEGQATARRMEAKCRKALPGLATYVKFIQPRWTCRVGDFQTRQDAEVFLKKVRDANISSQVTIVRCEIFKVY